MVRKQAKAAVFPGPLAVASSSVVREGFLFPQPDEDLSASPWRWGCSTKDTSLGSDLVQTLILSRINCVTLTSEPVSSFVRRVVKTPISVGAG